MSASSAAFNYFAKKYTAAVQAKVSDTIAKGQRAAVIDKMLKDVFSKLSVEEKATFAREAAAGKKIVAPVAPAPKPRRERQAITTPKPTGPRKAQGLTNFALFLRSHAKDYPLSNFEGTHKEKFKARSNAVTAAYKKLTPEELTALREKAVAEGWDKSTPKEKKGPRKLTNFSLFLKYHSKDYPFSNFEGTHSEKFKARSIALAAAFKNLTPEELTALEERYEAENMKAENTNATAEDDGQRATGTDADNNEGRK